MLRHSLLFVLSLCGCSAQADDLQLVYPDSNVSSRPFIEFRARDGRLDPKQPSVGHAFVMLGKEYDNGMKFIYGVGGFYPKHSDKSVPELINLVLSQGRVDYTLDDLRNDRSFQTYITPDQENKVKFIMKNWDSKKYSVVYHNCIGLSRDVARAAGLTVPEFDITKVGVEFPINFLIELDKMNTKEQAIQEGERESARVNAQRDAAISEATRINSNWNEKVRRSAQRRREIELDNAARAAIAPSTAVEMAPAAEPNLQIRPEIPPPPVVQRQPNNAPDKRPEQPPVTQKLN